MTRVWAYTANEWRVMSPPTLFSLSASDYFHARTPFSRLFLMLPRPLMTFTMPIWFKHKAAQHAPPHSGRDVAWIPSCCCRRHTSSATHNHFCERGRLKAHDYHWFRLPQRVEKNIYYICAISKFSFSSRRAKHSRCKSFNYADTRSFFIEH